MSKAYFVPQQAPKQYPSEPFVVWSKGDQCPKCKDYPSFEYDTIWEGITKSGRNEGKAYWKCKCVNGTGETCWKFLCMAENDNDGKRSSTSSPQPTKKPKLERQNAVGGIGNDPSLFEMNQRLKRIEMQFSKFPMMDERIALIAEYVMERRTEKCAETDDSGNESKGEYLY